MVSTNVYSPRPTNVYSELHLRLFKLSTLTAMSYLAPSTSSLPQTGRIGLGATSGESQWQGYSTLLSPVMLSDFEYLEAPAIHRLRSDGSNALGDAPYISNKYIGSCSS